MAERQRSGVGVACLLKDLSVMHPGVMQGVMHCARFPRGRVKVCLDTNSVHTRKGKVVYAGINIQDLEKDKLKENRKKNKIMKKVKINRGNL